DLVVSGVTVPDGRITVRVYPGPDTFGDIKTSRDGSFTTTVALKPGANHVEIEVLDAAGKTNRVARTIQYQVAASPAVGPAPQLLIDQPAAGVTLTDVSVLVSGRVDRSVARLSINNLAVSVNPDGSFQSRYYPPAGPQSFRVVAQTATGGTLEETRNVVIVYTKAVVNVFVRGGDTWILATVDGTDVDGGRVYHDAETDLAALALFAIAATTDAVDGPLARARGEVTARGAAIDPLADKILVIGTLSALALRGLAPLWAVTVVVLREVAAVWARSRAER